MTGLKRPYGKDRRIVFQSPFFGHELSFYRVCVRVLKQHQMRKFCATCKVQQKGMSLGFQIRKCGCWSIPFLLIMNNSSCYTILSCQEVSWSTFSQFQGVCSRRQANGMGVCFFSIQGVIQKGWWLYQVIALNQTIILYPLVPCYVRITRSNKFEDVRQIGLQPTTDHEFHGWRSGFRLYQPWSQTT